MAFALGLLGFIVIGQWVLIWRLLDRCLLQGRVPSLGPVRAAAPPEPPVAVDPRRKLFSVNLR